MAEKRATLILQLKDQASRALGGLRNGVQKLRQNWLLVTAAVAGFVAAGASVVKAFIKQENAIEALNIALKNQGIESQAVSKDLQEYAAQLQKVTTVGDETIIETQALLTTFGLVGDELKTTTKAALDLSAGLGIDLKAATLLLGKAAAGDITTLSRYGIKIAEGTKEADKFAEVMKVVNERFGGSAAARLNTFSGRVEHLSNRIGDLKEKIGAQLIPVLERWAAWGEKIVTVLEKINKQAGENLSVDEIAINTYKEKNRIIKHELTSRVSLLLLSKEEEDARRQELITNTNIINKLEERVKKQKEIAEQNAKTAQAVIDSNKKIGESVKDVNTTIKVETEKSASAAQDIWSSTVDVLASRFGNSLARMIVDGESFRDNMKGVWKDMARDFISNLGRLAINVQLGGAGGGGGGGGIVGAVRRIVGFQEGGVVMPRTGGTITRVAEAGEPEAIVPLNKSRGLGTTIVINAGVIVGSQNNVRELAKMIDYELYDLRRNRESVAFEAL